MLQSLPFFCRSSSFSPILFLNFSDISNPIPLDEASS
nr:MAG TPA: hypothetical protein [Caudoviricetes sp.]